MAGITVEKEMKVPDVDALRAALHATYDGVVLCEEIKPNPPVRENPEIGYARLTLRPGAVSKKQRPIHLAGERLTAMTTI